MPQPLNNITLTAPGYFGLNLEDSPVDLPDQYCQKADNAVIDNSGRLAARQALAAFDPTGLTSTEKRVLSLGRVVDGNVVRYIAGVDNNGVNELWELTDLDQNAPVRTVLTLPVGYTLATANVQIIDFAGRGIIIVPGSEMLVMEGGVLKLASAQTPTWTPPTNSAGGVIHTGGFTPTCGYAAFGRLWVSGVDGDNETIFYSDVLNPGIWLDLSVGADPLSTAGGIDVSENWGVGKDRVMGITAHNNNLVVFGRRSILVWGNPQGDPAATGGIFLADTIENIGLVQRDAVVSDGRDVLFMDDTGLRSLGRTIQEQSAAIGDLTRPIRRELQAGIVTVLGDLDANGIELAYSPEHSFVLIIMRGTGITWVADTRMPMQDGSYRITRWPGTEIETALFIEEENLLMFGMGGTDAVLTKYEGSQEYSGNPYIFEYTGALMSFGDAVRLKLVKQVDFTVVTEFQDAVAQAAITYFGQRQRAYTKQFTVLGFSVGSQYDQIEYNSGAEYGVAPPVLRSYRYNASGSGELVQITFKVPINGNTCSLAQINVQTKLGRII